MIKKYYGNLVKAFFREKLQFTPGDVNLIFHSISNASNHSNIYEISSERFVEICDYLNKLSVEYELLFGKKIKLCLTFDDGLKNFITTAFPIIKKYNFSVKIFVIVEKLLSRDPNYLNIKDLTLLSKERNIEIGVHGYYHRDLSKMDINELNNEFDQISETLAKFQQHFDSFSLPYGRASDLTIERLKHYKYKSIYLSDYGTMKKCKDGFCLNQRIDIWCSDSNRDIKDKIFNRWRFYFYLESFKSGIYRLKNIVHSL